MQRLGTIPTLAVVLLAAGCGADAPTDPPPHPTLGHLVAAGAMVTVSAPDHQYVFEAVRRY